MTNAHPFVRFEQPRIAREFREVVDGIAQETPAAVCPGEPPMSDPYSEGEVGRALKAAINERVRAGRLRRGEPIGASFDLDRDDCAASVLSPYLRAKLNPEERESA